MKKRSVSLTNYPCGTVVLEVITETNPEAPEPQVLAGPTAA